MPRPLLLLNVLLVAVAALAVSYIVREMRAPMSTTARRPAPAPAPATPPAPASDAPAGGYAVVASRNLFSPTRSEAPQSATASAPQLPKPNLFGVILRDGAPVAYLEDPTTKRVAGYRLGDAIAGGTVKQIGADHVVLNRPEGDVNVRLHDPAKPRPAPPQPPAAGQPGATPPVAAGTPGAQPARPVPPQPGMPVPPVPTPPAVTQPQPPPVLPRRPLPPSLLRRLPPSASDAPAQQ
jgi:hypothetical protein